MTSDLSLSIWLGEAQSVLRPEIELVNDHADAPGYILFATDTPEVYRAFLKYRITPESVPLTFTFELTGSMESRDVVTAALVEAQESFLKELQRLELAAKPSLIPIQGEDEKPVIIPMDLNHFGMNPWGHPKWRLIVAASRTYMVGGKWADNGHIEYRWIFKYGGDLEGYCLEKWLSPIEYAGTRAAWEEARDLPTKQPCEGCLGDYCLTCGGSGEIEIEGTGLNPLGPYPERGEFESAFQFKTLPPKTQVEKIIQMIEKGRQLYGFADIKRAHQAAIDAKHKAHDDRVADEILDILPAFPGKAMSGRSDRSGAKDFRITADQVPLTDAMPYDFEKSKLIH